MPPDDPSPIADVIVRYSAPEMPVNRIEELQTQTVRDLERDEITVRDGFRIVNLLLTIALMKLQEETT